MLKSYSDSLYVHAGDIITTKLACFDLDWTLIRPIHAKFFKSSDDWAFLPNRLALLKMLVESHTLVIFTNQNYKGSNLNLALERINKIIRHLNSEKINVWVFVSTHNDIYRKPNIGMWQVIEKLIHQVDIPSSFFCGDAAGRPTDHSDSDLLFSRNIGLTFYIPEQLFTNNSVAIPDYQTMFLFVGMPGAGKTTYYDKNLKPLGWVHINQDTLKTRAKVLSAAITAIKSGKSLAIDLTNPDPDKRMEFINMAIEHKIPTLILYFVANGHNRNNLRSKPVPTVAYNMYYKSLVEPSRDLDLVPVVEIL